MPQEQNSQCPSHNVSSCLNSITPIVKTKILFTNQLFDLSRNLAVFIMATSSRKKLLIAILTHLFPRSESKVKLWNLIF